MNACNPPTHPIVRRSLPALLTLCLAAPAWATDGLSLMQQSENATKSRAEAAVYLVDLLDREQKLIQSRRMEFFFKKLPGREATLIRFLSPAALQGTGLLIEDAGRSVNDLWLYLPATRKLRRLAGAEKTNWFMGTEFTNEDFEDYQLGLYRFVLGRDQPCGSSTCHTVTAEANDPVEKSSSGYSRKVYYLEKNSLYPVAIDYYLRDGTLGKQLSTQGLRQEGKYWRPTVIEMKNLQNGRSTRLTAHTRELDGPLDDFKVSSRYLRAE